MPNNPLFRASNSPTKTTKPTKAVNEVGTNVRLTHNTFDNSYFNFKTQRFGQYEPFWWKPCVAGDNEPFSNSHNVRSLPFASPILSPMKLNKDYFQVPMYAIQPNTWDYIFKNPSQGDDVPFDAQNLFPLQRGDTFSFFISLCDRIMSVSTDIDIARDFSEQATDSLRATASFKVLFKMLIAENFFSSGSLLYNLGYKFNPIFYITDFDSYSFDQIFDNIFQNLTFAVGFRIPDPDSPSGNVLVTVTNTDQPFDIYVPDGSPFESRFTYVVDTFTLISLCRSFVSNIEAVSILGTLGEIFRIYDYETGFGSLTIDDDDFAHPLDCIRMDVINAYQLSCAQYYVNPRVDFLYNAQLYRDNFIQLLRELNSAFTNVPISLASFDYNGLPVLYDYFSYHYYQYITDGLERFFDGFDGIGDQDDLFYAFRSLATIVNYLFGYREQLRFGNYFTDSRTQALGYGEPGSDVVTVFNNEVSVTDMSQKLVLERFRGAVAHLDNTAEDYLATMFHEDLPPDYHYPKFIAHSEFGINGEEVSNTTSDNQGNIITNLKSGQDTAEFNISISVPSILIGISYISIPELYSQIKERHYFHADRFDMFQPMLQYFGDQEIYNREVSDYIANPGDSYAYVSRNGEYKQRLSQVSGGFLTSLRSWVFTVDLPQFARESYMPRLSFTQSPIAIRAHDFEFNRFLARQTGLCLGSGFHFIMQYNNKNVDNRPMDVNPLPLYPNNSL